MMLFEILYIVHKRACLRREARSSHSRSLITEVRLKNIYNPLYKNEQLPFEYFPVYLHHIDRTGPRLVMHTPIWVEQESSRGDIWYPHRKTRSFFWSDLRSR